MAEQIDIGLDDSGDLPITAGLLTGDRLIAQRIRARLTRWLGEDLLDRRLGLPYLAWLQARPQPIAEIAALVRREIESVPGVTRVVDFEISGPTTAQRISISATVLTASQAEIAVTVLPLGTQRDQNASVLIRMTDFSPIVVPTP